MPVQDDILLDEAHQLYVAVTKTSYEELSMTVELSERIGALAYKEGRTTEDVNQVFIDVEEKYGIEYGLASPSYSENSGIVMPVLARGTPLSKIAAIHRTEHAQRLLEKNVSVKNSWDTKDNRTVSVINTNMGPVAWYEFTEGDRLRKFMTTLTMRMDSQISAESEMKALELLKTKINESQYRCYILNGAFPEQSKKSDLHYMFRKGHPTLALSWHGEFEGKVLAALCLHPYGWYPYSFAGVMCPTDEVICQLLMMRADEHKFWAKSGQWQVTDIRSGV